MSQFKHASNGDPHEAKAGNLQDSDLKHKSVLAKPGSGKRDGMKKHLFLLHTNFTSRRINEIGHCCISYLVKKKASSLL